MFVKLHNHGIISDNMPYMVLQTLGHDLGKLAKMNGSVLPEQTVGIIGIQILNALQALHSLGYVHADLKPANVLIGSKDLESLEC